MPTTTTTLLCLHGFSQNGAVLQAHLQPLLARLPSELRIDAPDAPHACSPRSVERLYAFLKTERSSPPHRCFWDATDDGRQYRGWEQTLEQLRARVAGSERVGVFGFSQGAIVTAALCALAEHGQFPAIAFAVMVAGRTPRSDVLRPLFEQRLSTPSLHVWGERDFGGTTHAQQLSECFDAATREVVVWPGPHVVPTRGPAADAIAAFVGKQLHTARS